LPRRPIDVDNERKFGALQGTRPSVDVEGGRGAPMLRETTQERTTVGKILKKVPKLEKDVQV